MLLVILLGFRFRSDDIVEAKGLFWFGFSESSLLWAVASMSSLAAGASSAVI